MWSRAIAVFTTPSTNASSSAGGIGWPGGRRAPFGWVAIGGAAGARAVGAAAVAGPDAAGVAAGAGARFGAGGLGTGELATGAGGAEGALAAGAGGVTGAGPVASGAGCAGAAAGTDRMAKSAAMTALARGRIAQSIVAAEELNGRVRRGGVKGPLVVTARAAGEAQQGQDGAQFGPHVDLRLGGRARPLLDLPIGDATADRAGQHGEAGAGGDRL